MDKEADPGKEGHTREWQDRARVMLDAEKKVRGEASPNQSPFADTEKEPGTEDVEEKSKNLKEDKEVNDSSTAY